MQTEMEDKVTRATADIREQWQSRPTISPRAYAQALTLLHLPDDHVLTVQEYASACEIEAEHLGRS